MSAIRTRNRNHSDGTAHRVFRISGGRIVSRPADAMPVGAPITAARADGRPTEDDIRRAAYLKWLAAGAPPSDGVEFWLAAERELRPA